MSPLHIVGVVIFVDKKAAQCYIDLNQHENNLNPTKQRYTIDIGGLAIRPEEVSEMPAKACYQSKY